jgi:nucleoside-diphosphate-sugar epimerase
MFLGQIFDALKKQQPFKMSGGTQLREYQRVEDIAQVILRRMGEEWSGASPVIRVGTGQPFPLLDLARPVFEKLGRAEDLQVGALASSAGEIHADPILPSPEGKYSPSEDPRDGVVRVLSQALSALS